jgi:hypothetical protein
MGVVMGMDMLGLVGLRYPGNLRYSHMPVFEQNLKIIFRQILSAALNRKKEEEG